MSFLRQLSRGMRSLLHRASADRDVADEVRQYLDDATAAHRARGLSPDDAARAARDEIGNDTLVREGVRSYGWENLVETWAADLRVALRQVRRHAGFSVPAILVLALGLGAATAIFSAVNPILFQTLPYPRARQLTMLWEGRRGSGSMLNFAEFRGIAEQSRSFDSLAAMKAWEPAMTGPAQPERFQGQRVSADFFRVLGVTPALGRSFQAADDLHHGPNVVILSHALWERQFHSDAGIIGRAVTLDDNAFTVIGVMPAGFEDVLAPGAELWAPLQYDPALLPDTREYGHHLRVVARLRPGVTRAQAIGDLHGLIPRLAQEFARGFATSGGPPARFLVDTLQDDITQDVRPALMAVMGAVLLVLLIACVNVTNLLLARGAQRRGEFAMRIALGASRARLLRQFATESLLVSLLGGLFGLVIAEYGVRALVALSPPELPRLSAIRVDAAVFVFAFAIAALVGLLVGIVPALHAFRADLHGGMRAASRTSAGGHQRMRRGLVITEVALALVLLVSAGLLLRSLGRLFSTDAGFDSAHLLTMRVDEASRRYTADTNRFQFYSAALDAVRAVPGVTAAAFTSQLPLSGDNDVYGIEVEGDSAKAANQLPALRYAVTADYFTAMRTQVLRGRAFNERDTATSPRVVIINESLARKEFGNQNPLGRRICLRCTPTDRPWSTVVGVVPDVKQTSLAVGPEDAFYLPVAQWYWVDNEMALVARTQGDPGPLAAAIKRAVWSVDKDQPITKVATMQSLMLLSQARRRFALFIFEAFALVGLLLAATGLYGVLSGGVTERLREIGVRAALGATRSDLIGLIVRQGMWLMIVGIVAGVAGALAATRLLASLLFAVSAADPLTYSGVIALLGVVSLLACLVPAWRAARVDPAVILRAE